MGVIKRILCITLCVLMCAGVLSGCAEDTDMPELYSETSSENKTELGARNIDEINSMLKSWEIFSDALEDADPDSEDVTGKIKDAIECETNNRRIDLRLVCPAAKEKVYRAAANEFCRLYSAAERYKINIKVTASDTPSAQNITSPKEAPDVFFYSDTELSDIISAGAVSRVNESLEELVSAYDSAGSISAFTNGGGLYGFPCEAGTGELLVYDKSLFADSDIGELDKMIDVADSKSSSVALDMEDIYITAGFFLSAGCELKNDGVIQLIGYDTANGMAAARALRDLAQRQGRGFTAKADSSTVIGGFADGTIAAAVTDKKTALEIMNTSGRDVIAAAELPSVSISGVLTPLHSFAEFEGIGVDPYTSFPFTAQLFAYFLSKRQYQTAVYDLCGAMPAANIENYSYIRQDPLYMIMEAQRERTHIRAAETCSELESLLEKNNIGRQLVRRSGTQTDEELYTMLSLIPLSIPTKLGAG